MSKQSYWESQPLNIIGHQTTDVVSPLPEGFSIKELDTHYLDEIYQLLTYHNLEDEHNIIRFTYSRSFLLWYLKNISDGLLLGLIYQKKLVGTISAIIIEMILDNSILKVPYVNLLCIQKKIRNLGLAAKLIEEMKIRLNRMGYQQGIFASTKKLGNYFSSSQEFVIPINYARLKMVGLFDDPEPIKRFSSNPLHLMTKDDLKVVTFKLNRHLKRYRFRPYLTEDICYRFLYPRKNIAYSFVRRNENGDVTDFVAVYYHRYYCLESKKTLAIAQLALYYHETMTLTELINYLLDKLASYQFDQFVFRTHTKHDDINITKYLTYGRLYYYSYNFEMPLLADEETLIYPL